MARSRTRTKAASGADLVKVLRERISLHEIPPGSKLLESQLAADFGVSRTVVREAFTELELRGLIERVPNRGAIVSRLALEQVYEIYDAREALEGMCIRLAAQKAKPESWQDLVDVYRPGGPMEKFLESGDVEAFFANYEKVRRRIIEAAQNEVIAGMLDSILEKSRVIMRRVQILPGRAARGLREHRAFLKALRAGNAEEAERLRRENIRSAIKDLRRYQHFVI